MPVLKIATIAMNTTDDKKANIAKAFHLVEQAATLGADWVQLPEMFPFMGSYKKLSEMAESEDGPLVTQLAELASTKKVVLFAGSIQETPETPSSARVYNTSFVFDRTGQVIAKYRKTHLFNLQASGDAAAYRESDGYIPGSQVQACTVDGLKVGLGICYDIRFPDFFQAIEKKFGDVDIYSLPSAFTFATGSAHWHLLLRARAVERQAYIFAANQVGSHGPGKTSYGHSVVIDPWGDIIADTGSQEGIGFGVIDTAKLQRFRHQLPALNNRVRDLS